MGNGRASTRNRLIPSARESLTHIDAICPGFSADCLEKTDEVGHEGRLAFQEAGNGRFHYIPALNERPDHIEFLADLALRQLSGWLESDPISYQVNTSPNFNR